MVGHPRDEVRPGLERHARRREVAVRGLDVRDPEVEDRAGVVELGAFRAAEHQPDLPGAEERQVRRREEVLEAEDVAVERHRPPEVPHVDADLPDGPQVSHGLTP